MHVYIPKDRKPRVLGLSKGDKIIFFCAVAGIHSLGKMTYVVLSAPKETIEEIIEADAKHIHLNGSKLTLISEGEETLTKTPRDFHYYHFSKIELALNKTAIDVLVNDDFGTIEINPDKNLYYMSGKKILKESIFIFP